MTFQEFLVHFIAYALGLGIVEGFKFIVNKKFKK